jgi:hypothetical protein
VAPGPAAEHHRQQVREGAGQGLQGEAGHDHRDQPGHMGLQVGDRGAGRHGAQVGHDRDREPGHAGPQHPGRGRVRGPAQGRADERDQRHRQPGRIGGQPGRGHHSALAGQPGGGHGQTGGQWRQRPADRSLQPRHHARPQHGRPQGELGEDRPRPAPPSRARSGGRGPVVGPDRRRRSRPPRRPATARGPCRPTGRPRLPRRTRPSQPAGPAGLARSGWLGRGRGRARPPRPGQPRPRPGQSGQRGPR